MSVVNLTGDGAVAVTTADSVKTVDPAGPFVGLIVWVAGTVSFLDGLGNESGISGSLTAGTVIPVKVTRVRTTGTTATVLGIKGVA